MKSAEQVKNVLARFEPFQKSFFLQDTVEVAKGLIGSYLLHLSDGGVLAGRIVETEAYRQDDPASHSFRGLTRRNRHMFEAGGLAYVYFIYGMYNCFNVVTEPEGVGCAVLIRAMEPVCNPNLMWANRFPGKPVDPRAFRRLADGPGKLCLAMAITREHDGTSLFDGPLRICRKTEGPGAVISESARIGVKRAADLPWRFFDAASNSVSR